MLLPLLRLLLLNYHLLMLLMLYLHLLLLLHQLLLHLLLLHQLLLLLLLLLLLPLLLRRRRLRCGVARQRVCATRLELCGRRRLLHRLLHRLQRLLLHRLLHRLRLLHLLLRLHLLLLRLRRLRQRAVGRRREQLEVLLQPAARVVGDRLRVRAGRRHERRDERVVGLEQLWTMSGARRQAARVIDDDGAGGARGAVRCRGARTPRVRGG